MAISKKQLKILDLGLIPPASLKKARTLDIRPHPDMIFLAIQNRPGWLMQGLTVVVHSEEIQILAQETTSKEK